MEYIVIRVREDVEDNTNVDFKVFQTKASAAKYAKTYTARVKEDEIDEVAAFLVRNCEDVYQAKAVVQAGEMNNVELLGVLQSPYYQTQIFIRDYPIDLTDILEEPSSEVSK